MKKAWKVLLVALSLLILTSCEYVNKKEEGPVRVGLLLTSSPDEAYSEGYYGYAALKTLEKNYEIEIAYNENVVTPDGAGYLLNGYGRNGYDLVIGLGEMFNQPMIDASVSYPETKFVCINGQLSEGNVTSYNLPDEQVAYLAGALAGKMSSSTAVGYVLKEGMTVYFEDFLKGLRGVNPNATAEVLWVKSSLGFSESLGAMSNAGIRGVGLYYNSPELENLLQSKGISAGVVGGYSGQGEQRLAWPRVAYDYTLILDRVYKDFKLDALKGITIPIGFKERAVYMDSFAGLDEAAKVVIEGIIKNFN